MAKVKALFAGNPHFTINGKKVSKAEFEKDSEKYIGMGYAHYFEKSATPAEPVKKYPPENKENEDSGKKDDSGKQNEPPSKYDVTEEEAKKIDKMAYKKLLKEIVLKHGGKTEDYEDMTLEALRELLKTRKQK